MSDPSVSVTRSEEDYPEIGPAARKASRVKLVLIIAIFGIPLLLASIYLHLVRTSGGQLGDTSRGQLIQPAVPLTEFSLQQQEGAFDLDSLRGIWTLLYMPTDDCANACQQNLYHMRQVRLALNHRMDRVQRAVLAVSPGQIGDALMQEHPGLMLVTGSAAEQAALRDQVHAAEASMPSLENPIYLIDPFGNVMLRFPPDLEPKSMLKDIKHLLKVSRIG